MATLLQVYGRFFLLSRVTRLADFSSIGQLFENYRSSPYFWATFFHGKSYAFDFDKKWVGLHFG
jgi:hypothetical protein